MAERPSLANPKAIKTPAEKAIHGPDKNQKIRLNCCKIIIYFILSVVSFQIMMWLNGLPVQLVKLLKLKFYQLPVEKATHCLNTNQKVFFQRIQKL